MSTEPNITLGVIFFVYGLAFFSMGLAVLLEGGRGYDMRLRLALRPLAAFGLIHGINEWLDMFQILGIIGNDTATANLYRAFLLIILAFSFLSLSGFGFSALASDAAKRRISFLGPLTLAAIWGFGLLLVGGNYPQGETLWHVADVWTRYTLGIPSAVIASIGLIAQQRAFRRAGMAEFGRDSLVAAIAFGWYGLVGQLFTPASRLWPSTFLNQELFLHWFHFPIQLLRAGLAIIIATYVIRFMRAFDIEINRQIDELQATQLQEAQQREALRAELLKRVVRAQEAERQRIARELHDETGQSLTALGLGLRAVADAIDKDPKKAFKNLRKLETLTASSIDELQRVIAALRPAHLDELGLPAALRWYVNEVLEHAEDLKINFHTTGQEARLPEEVKVAIFRVVQEALTNILKHAVADTAEIRLIYALEKIIATISDDGIGMNLDILNMENRSSWGLLGMQERVALLGGDFYIKAAPNRGVTIQITIPLLTLNNHIIIDSETEPEVPHDDPSITSG